MPRSLVIGSVVLALLLLVATPAVMMSDRGADGGTAGRPLLDFDTASVRALEVRWSDSGRAVRVTRGPTARWWIVEHRPDEAPRAWPALERRVRGFLRLLANLEGEERAPAGADEAPDGRGETVVRIELLDGAREISFSSLAAGGLALARRDGEDGRQWVIAADFYRTLQPPGPLAWRDDRVFPNLERSDLLPPSRIELRAEGRMVELRRRGGRWMVRDGAGHGPVPADEARVASLLRALGSIRVRRFETVGAGADAGAGGGVIIETDWREAGGPLRTRRQELRIGGAADVGGETVRVVLSDTRASSPEVIGPGAHPGEFALAVGAEPLGEVRVALEAYVDRRPFAHPPEEVYGVRAFERAQASVPGAVGAPLFEARRGLDGWEVESVAEGVRAGAIDPAGVEALVRWLVSPAERVEIASGGEVAGTGVRIELLGLDGEPLARRELRSLGEGGEGSEIRAPGIAYRPVPANQNVRALLAKLIAAAEVAGAGAETPEESDG